MTDLTRRYACSLYVDLRLGLLGGRVRNPDEARHETAKVYGTDAATYAQEVCD